MKIVLLSKFVMVAMLISGVVACGNAGDSADDVEIPEAPVASTPPDVVVPTTPPTDEPNRYTIPDCPEGDMLPAYNCKTPKEKSTIINSSPTIEAPMAKYTIYEIKCDFMGKDFKDDPDAEDEDCFSSFAPK